MTRARAIAVAVLSGVLGTLPAGVSFGEIATCRLGAPAPGGALKPMTAAVKAQAPTAYAPAVPKAPTLDGRLDDECWKSAFAVRLVRTLDGGGAAAQPTEVLICRDTDNLYLAFRCTEPLVEKLNPGRPGKDVPVWESDAVEFFLGCNGTYYHFGVNAAGGVYDAAEKEKDWDSGFQARAARGAGEWTVEAAVPLEKMAGGKGAAPAEWIANFNRDRQATGELQESAWSPTFSTDSHMPERFGKLLLREPPAGGAAEHAKPGPALAGAVSGKGVEVLPVANGAAVLRFDLSKLQGARVLRADLAIARNALVDGQLDEALTDIEAYPLYGEFKAGAEAKAGGQPLAVRGPWFDTLDATEAVSAWAGGKPNGGFFIEACPLLNAAGTCLDIVYEGRCENPPPQVTGVKAEHRNGQTFVTWKEIEDLAGRDDATWGTLKPIVDGLDAGRQVRYRVYRSDKPITPATLGAAELIATVKPLSCWNVNGRNIERPIDIEIATKDYKAVGQWNPFQSATLDGEYGHDCPIDRLAIGDGDKELPRGTGLYVHTPAAPGRAFYAVVTMVDGAANTSDMSGNVSQPVAETVAEPAPVLQREMPRMPFFNYADKRYQYVQWVGAPKYANIPSQYYNWSVAVPESVLAAMAKSGKTPAPMELTLHRDGDSYWRTQFRMERNSVVLAPYDFPIRSWWYGYHENYGTLKSYRQGAIQPYTERRMLAFMAWAERAWPIDRNKIVVTGCRGGASAGGALHLGLRHPELFSLVVSGHGSPTYADLATAMDKKGPAWSAVTLQGAFGKPEWALKTDQGKAFYDQMDMNKLLAALPPAANLPLVALTSNNGPVVRQFHQEMLEGGRPILAEFSWGGGRYMPVTSTETFPNAIRLDIRRDASVLAFRTLEATKTLGGGMGEFNRNFTWRDVTDSADKYEVTILGGRGAADVTIRQLQQFKVAAGKSYHWTIKDVSPPAAAPKARKPDVAPPPSEGDATAGHDVVLRINGIGLAGQARLTVTPK